MGIAIKTIPISIPANGSQVQGDLTVPPHANELIIFAHGSGSSRLSPRNTFVAKILNNHGVATLLFDLLTEEEDERYENRFNIQLLTERLEAVTRFIQADKRLDGMHLGYFGASTGSAAAIQAAARQGDQIGAVVSRGGRPDLTDSADLARIQSPTLLIVGGSDYEVIELNKQAYAKMVCIKELSVIPEATHLFEEDNALEQVAGQAAHWFKKYLRSG